MMSFVMTIPRSTVLAGRFSLWPTVQWTSTGRLRDGTVWALVLALTACLGGTDHAPMTDGLEVSGVDVIEDTIFTARANGGGGFSQVGAVEYGADGEVIALVDGQRVIRIGQDGTPLSTAERIGGGPGEWRYVIWAGADSLGIALVDVASFRFVRLAWDLSPIGDTRVPSVVRGGAVIGRLQDGAFISLLDPPVIPGIGQQQFFTTIIKWRPESDQVDTVAALPGTDVFIDPAEQMFVRVPAGRVDWAAARDSIVVGGNGGGDSVFVQVKHKASQWVRLQGLPKSAPVSRSRIDAFIDEEIATMPDLDDRKRMRRTFAKVAIPRHSPRFERLLLDDRGWIWCGAQQEGNVRVWQAFSLTGEPMGHLRLPARARPWLIDQRRIIATVSDDDGLQRIVQYRIR